MTLGPEHRTLARLLGAVLAAAARLSPPIGRSLLALFDARRDFERDGGLLTARLVHAFAERAKPLMIVLDDAHELTGARAALAWTAALIEATPASVRFVIAARGESPFTRGRFARSGRAHAGPGRARVQSHRGAAAAGAVACAAAPACGARRASRRMGDGPRRRGTRQ